MKAFAKVRVYIEVDIHRWTENDTIKEMFKKSKKEAVEQVFKLRNPLYPDSPPRIVVNPEIIGIFQPENEL